MNEAIIYQNYNYKIIIKKIVNNIKESLKKQEERDYPSILILVDLPGPQRFPTGVNKEHFIYFIKNILDLKPKKLLLLPISDFGIENKKIIEKILPNQIISKFYQDYDTLIEIINYKQLNEFLKKKKKKDHKEFSKVEEIKENNKKENNDEIINNNNNNIQSINTANNIDNSTKIIQEKEIEFGGPLDFAISYTQLRVSVINGIFTATEMLNNCIYALFQLEEKKDKLELTYREIEARILQFVEGVNLKYFIHDGFYIGNFSGPYLELKTDLIRKESMVFSSNLISLEKVTFNYLQLSPIQQSFSEYLLEHIDSDRETTINIIKLMPDAEELNNHIERTENDNETPSPIEKEKGVEREKEREKEKEKSIINEKEFNELKYKKLERKDDERKGKRFRDYFKRTSHKEHTEIDLNIVENQGTIIDPLEKTKFQFQTNKISIPKQDFNIFEERIYGLHLYIGQLSVQQKHQLLLLLERLTTLLHKDSRLIKNWALFAGKEPPVPSEYEKHNYYIIWGDEAIISTIDYPFRRIIKIEEVLSRDELERKFFQKQSDIREKILQLETNFQIIKEEIEQKDDLLEKELELHKAKINLAIKTRKYEAKMALYRVKQEIKQKIREQKNNAPKVKLNKAICEISGTAPSIYDSLYVLMNFWGPFKAPTLKLWVEHISEYYNFKPYNIKHIKQKWKRLENELKAELKKKYAPIKPAIKEQLKKLKEEKTTQIKQIKEKLKEDIKKIKEEHNKIWEQRKKELEIEIKRKNENSEIKLKDNLPLKNEEDKKEKIRKVGEKKELKKEKGKEKKEI